MSFAFEKLVPVQYREYEYDLFLRTVPTKYQGFCAKLGLREKSRSLKGLLESTKKNLGSHAFFRDN